MKSNPSFNLRRSALFFVFALAVLLAWPSAVRAGVPGLTLPANIAITDELSTNLFTTANVTEGDTNVLTVYLNYGPANFGTLNPLPSGVVQVGTNYLIAATNAAEAETILGSLVFTPVANLIPVPNFSNVTFHAYVLDASTNSNTSATRTTTLKITAKNNSPTLANGAPLTHAITDVTNTLVFTGVTIADVDNSGTQAVTVTIKLDAAAKGELTTNSLLAAGFTDSGTSYEFTGTAAAATTKIALLKFAPTPNRVPVGLTETTTFTITVDDAFATTTNVAYSVTATSVNDQPELTGVTTNHFAAQTGHSAQPFAVLTILDADPNTNTNITTGENLTWSVSLGGPTPLGHLELNGSDIGTNYASADEPAGATADLRSLVYRAPTLAIAGTNVLTFAVKLDDGHGSLVTSNLFLDLFSVVSPPGLSGTQAGQIVNDNTTIAPFSKVNIQSFNGSSITVRLQLADGATNDAQGQLVNLGGFTRTTFPAAPSLYQFTGTSESATATIRALLFQPTPNRINGSSTDTAVFGITLVDGPLTNVTDTTTTVIVVPVNDAPIITGISALVTIQDSETLTPFTTTLVTDADESGQQALAASITLDIAAKGTFSAASLLVSGFTNVGSSYTFNGPAANLTTAIRQLVFVPTPNRVPVGLNEVTTFTLALNDGHGGSIANGGTQVRVVSSSGLPIITLPQPQPISVPFGTNIFPFQSVSVADATLLKVSVRINSSVQGAFTTNSVAAGGFTNLGGGVYYITGLASNITAALAQLDFAPSVTLPLGAVINFTISVTNALPNFVTANHAIVLRTAQNSFIVTKLTDYDPNGSAPLTEKNGTLRKAIADAKNNDHITFDIRSTVEGQPDYPATIRLVAPLTLDNNLTFDGPGAEQLTISGDTDTNGTPDLQLFTVNAEVTMNRLTFTKGYASYAGGAFEVTSLGDLKLSYCAVTDSTADVWGGGVDVDHGSLILDHCFIAGNKTSSSLGQGGGGVSLYTELACSLVNTTFSTNRQVAIGGLGGGALYVETADAGTELNVLVLSCTFHDNRDAAGHGTAIRPNVFNTFVKLQNTIVADGQGKNIEMDQSGAVISLGGNISDDATATTFSSGGAATNTFIFHAPLDLVNYSATNFLAALANNGGPTPTFALTATNLALGNAASNVATATFYATLGTDQRGYFRDHSPDIGAFERNASQRIIIQEIHFNPAAPNTNNEFVEFYVPRDSAPLAVDGFKLLVDGNLRHTFTSQSLQPGEALVLFSHDALNTGLPSGVYSQIAAANLALDNASGNVALLNASNQVVYEADYVGAFTSTDPNDYGLLTNNQSLVLSPAFTGVFLPYQRVVAKQGGSDTNSFSNPGYDVTGRPLAIGNAPPLAYADAAATDAHTALTNLNVLVNDVEPDITDVIRVVDVGTNGNVSGVTNYSVLGARIISQNSGASISYDPTASAYLTALPQGSNVVDSFQYAILDASNGVDHVRGSTVLEIAQNLAKATATVTVNVVGVNSAPTPQADDVNTNPTLTTPEDVVLDFVTVTNLLANDTDPNSDDNYNSLNIVSLSATNGYSSNTLSVVTLLGATATLDIRFDRNETHITYDPRGSAILNTLGFGQTTNDAFYYSVKDRYNVIGTALVHLQVTGVNDVPTANTNLLATDEDTAITVADATLLANDTDYDQLTVLHISAVTPVSAWGASVTLVGTNVIYNPTVSTNLNALANKEFAADTFTYTALDEHGLSSNAVVTVIVAGVNDRPVLQPDAYATDEETLFTTNAPGVLVNDVEPDINGLLPEDAFRVIPATNVTLNGVVMVLNADGSFGYNPYHLFDWLKELQTTNEYIDYVVMDHSLSVASDDTFAATTSSSNNILPVLANDVVLSAVGGAFTLTGVTTPNHGGTVAINGASNAIIYTPLAGYVGAETFSYTAADALGGSDTAVVSVTLTASTLTANPDSYTVASGTTNSLDLLGNDSLLPVTGASLTLASLGSPSAGGTVVLNGVGPNNLVSYTPNPTNPCPFVETFTYRVTSGALAATGTVSVTVLDRNNSLTANNDFFTVIANGGNNSLDVLGNDVILPGSNTNLTITSFNSNSVLGTVSLNTAHTRLVYKPSALVTSQPELISYTIADGAGGTASAVVLVQVVTNGFVANKDTFVVVKNSTNTLPVMINDVILPNLGQTLFISGIGIDTNAPNHGGTVTINGPGTGLVYQPAANFNGAEDFTYEISDGSPARALGRVRVVVLDNSAAPSNPDTYRVARASVNNALRVLRNDYSLPKTFGAYTIVGLQTNNVHGTVALNNSATNNWLLYTPDAGFIGTDFWSYEFTDLLGNKGTNLVAVTVGDLAPNNDQFRAVSDSVTNILAVRANDLVYPDSTSLRPIYQLSTPDQGGVVTTNSTATAVLYTPAPGFVGTEHFTYTLKDDSANLFAATATVVVMRRGSDRETNTVTMTVIGVNDIPTIAGSTNSAITDKQTVNPFANISLGDLDEYGLQLQTATILMDHLDNESLQNIGGFSQTSPGVFTMQDTPTNISAALRAIVFVPTPNHIIVPTTVTTHLLLSIDDGYISTPVTNLTTVAVTAVNDSPTTAGAGNYNITDKQTIHPFAAIVIADVDDDALQSLTVRIALDHLDNQTLTNLGGFTPVTNGGFALSGTPANLTMALRGIVFAPVENHIIVPTTVTTRLTLTVDDAFAPTVTNATTTVAVTAVNDAPTTAGAGNYNITDKQTVNPFAAIVIADVDDDALQLLTVHLELDNLDKQSLTNLGGFTQVTNGVFALSDTPTNLTMALRGIVFVPTPNHLLVPTSITTHLLLAVDDSFAPTVANNITTVTITATNDAPTITGNGNYNISDKQTVQPFASLVVADVDDDTVQPLTVRLVLDHLDNGALQSLGGFTQTSNGVFTLHGTPTNITSALRGMTYVPVPNHIPVPTTQTTHLTLSADDGFISAWVTNLTTVNITASNDVPVITGTVAGQIVYDRGFIRPFTSTVITELDNDRTQALRITVTLDSATKGGLSDLGGFVNLGSGVYSYGASNGTVTAALATTALRGLLFTPTTASRVTPGAPEITRFTLRVDDFFAPTVVDTNTTVVAIDALTAKVTASDKTVGAQFGWAVAATRDLAVIGAPKDPANTNSGAAYIFARSLDGSNTWTQIKKLLSPDGKSGDEFGTAVAISSNTIVVGARLKNLTASDMGAAYVFERNSSDASQWDLVTRLVASDGGFNDQFGTAVAISVDTIVVGAPLSEAVSKNDSGAAYLYERNAGGINLWGEVKKLVASDPDNSDHFADSVAIQADTVVVGSPLADAPAKGNAGAAYVFGRHKNGSDQWGQLAKLVSADAVAADNFGTAVAIEADTLIVGSPFADAPAKNDAGAAYVFTANLGDSNQWNQVKKLVSADALAADHFGTSLAFNADFVIVGSPGSDGNGGNAGAAYLFSRHQGGTNLWGQVDKFLPAAVGASDNFGGAVALNRNTIVVGAYDGLDSGVRSGTAYMFRIKYNNAPRVALPLSNQVVTPTAPLAYTLPAGAFSDADEPETLGLSLGGGAPVWLNFNNLTGAFSGTPNALGSYPITVVVTDSDGATATNQFLIDVLAVPDLSSTLALGFQTFGTNQLIVVTLNGVSGVQYRLQRTPSLSGTVVWTDVASGTADNLGAITFYDVSAGASMFYRTVAP